MREHNYNAPAGVFNFYSGLYSEYEQHTSNWKIEDENGDFVFWECFDRVDWETKYCATYKERAYAYSSDYWSVRDRHDSAKSFIDFMKNFE